MSGCIVYVKANSTEELSLDLDIGETTFGSSIDANVRFKGRKNIEPIHCVLKVSESGYAIIYNKSKKWPVQVNGEEVQIFKVLKHDDKFTLEGNSFIYKNEKITDKVAEKVAALLKQNISQAKVNQVLKTFKMSGQNESEKNLKKTPAKKSSLGKFDEKCKTTSKIITKKALNTPRIRKRLSLNEYPVSPSMRKSCVSSRNIHFENIPEEIVSEEKNSPVFQKTQNTSMNLRKCTDKIELTKTDNQDVKSILTEFTSNHPKRSKSALSLNTVKQSKNAQIEKAKRKFSLPVKESKRLSFRRYSEASKKRQSKNRTMDFEEEMHEFNEEKSKISCSGTGEFILFSDNEDNVFSPDRKSVDQTARSSKRHSKISKSLLENGDDGFESSMQSKSSCEMTNDDIKKFNISVKSRKSIHSVRRSQSANLSVNKSVNVSSTSTDSLDLFDSNSDNEPDISSKNKSSLKSSPKILVNSAESPHKSPTKPIANTSQRRSVGRPPKRISKINKSGSNSSALVAHVTAEDEINFDFETPQTSTANETKNVDMKSEKRRVGRPSKRLSTKTESKILDDSSNTVNGLPITEDSSISNFNKSSSSTRANKKSSDDSLRKSTLTPLSKRNSTRKSGALNDSVNLNTSQNSKTKNSKLLSSQLNLSKTSTRKVGRPSKQSINISSNSQTDIDNNSQTEEHILQLQESDLEDEVLTNTTLQSSTPYATRTMPRFTYNSQSTETDEVIEVSSLSTSSNNSKTRSFRRTSSVVFIGSDTNATQTSKTPDRSESVIYMGVATSLNANKSVEDTPQETPEKNPTFSTEFKTPSNTPRVFENLRKSVLKSRTRLSALKSAKNLINTPQKNVSPSSLTKSPNRSLKLVNLGQNEKISTKSPKNDLSNVSGVKDLFSTPIKAKTPKQIKRLQKSPMNDLSNVSGVKDIMKSPAKSPRNDLTNISGIGELFSTPKDKSIINSSLDDLPNSFLRIPIEQESSENNLSKTSGTRRSMKLLTKSKEIMKSPRNDLTNISGIGELFATPKDKSKEIGNKNSLLDDLPSSSLRTSIEHESSENDSSKTSGTRRSMKLLTKSKEIMKSPRNDLTNISGIGELFTTPKDNSNKSAYKHSSLVDLRNSCLGTPIEHESSHKNNLTKTSGTRRSMKLLSKSKEIMKSPRNDLTNISGIGELFTTPKDNSNKSDDLFNITSDTSIEHESSQNNLSRTSGTRRSVKSLPKSPKIGRSELNIAEKLGNTVNIKSPDMLESKTLMSPQTNNKSSENTVLNASDVKELTSSPVTQKSPQKGIAKAGKGRNNSRRTPKLQKEPKNDLTDVAGVKRLLKTPKIQKEPKNDLTNVSGVKRLMRTPKVQKEPKNDLTNVVGVKRLLKTPKVQKQPKNDLTDIAGVKKLLRTPKIVKEPKNDLQNIVPFKKIFRTPKETKSPKNDLSNVSGVNYLFESPLQNITNKNENDDVEGDLFDKICNRQKLRTYSGKSPGKLLNDSFVSDGEPTVTSFVKEWVEEQNSGQVSDSVDKKRKNEKENVEPSSKRQKTKKELVKEETNNVFPEKRTLRSRKASANADSPIVAKSTRRGKKHEIDTEQTNEVVKQEEELENLPKRGRRKLAQKITKENVPEETISSKNQTKNVEETETKPTTKTTRRNKKIETPEILDIPETNTTKSTRGKKAKVEEAVEVEVVTNKSAKSKRTNKKVQEYENINEVDETIEEAKSTRSRRNAVKREQVEEQKTEKNTRGRRNVINKPTLDESNDHEKSTTDRQKTEVATKPKRTTKKNAKAAEILLIEAHEKEEELAASKNISEVASSRKTRRGKKVVEIEEPIEKTEEKPKRKRTRKNVDTDQLVEVEETNISTRPKRQCRKN